MYSRKIIRSRVDLIVTPGLMMNCFCGMVDQWKILSLISESLSEIPTIANLGQAANRI